jgi:5-carboxymethyl-2-hydroxymuconate isomerase
MADKKQKRPVEAINGLYSAIPHAVLDSVAFKGASYPAKALIFDLMRQHDGKNNGHLHLSFSWLAGRCWKSRDVIQRARAELLKRNLVIQTRQGGLNMGASRYAVTWLAISNFAGLDVQAKSYHPGAWTFMNEIPMGKKNTIAHPSSGKGSPAIQDSTLPQAGTA